MQRHIRAPRTTPDQIDHLECYECQEELRRTFDQGVSWHMRSPDTPAISQVALSAQALAALVTTVSKQIKTNPKTFMEVLNIYCHRFCAQSKGTSYMILRVLQWPQILVQRMAGVALAPQPLGEVARERLRLLRLFRSAPMWMTGVLGIGLVLEGVGPSMLALSTGWLIGELNAGPVTLGAMTPALIGFATVLLLQQTGRLITDAVGAVLGRQIDRRMRHRIRNFALEPAQIDHLERPEYQDELRRASDQGVSWRVRSPGTAAIGQAVLTFRLLAAIGAALVLAAFSVWLAAALLCAVILIRSIIRTQWMELAAREDGFAGEKRQASYWTDLAADVAAAKEVRLFGLGEWVVTRRREVEEGWVSNLWRTKNTVYGRQSGVLLLAVAAASAALVFPGLAALQGAIEVGELAKYIAAAWGVFGMAAVGLEQFDIERGIEAVRAYDRLHAGTAAVSRESTPGQVSGNAPPSIEFDSVAYRYVSGGAPVLNGLDLQIAPGRVTAIVGGNGAGKTTMMKLLAGLYRPTAGCIRIDGTDLSEIDPRSWRNRLSVLFQDFIRYPLSATENITLGAGNLPPDPEALSKAVRNAGVDKLITDLPGGTDTPLSRNRTGGSDLSGGQWQRLALARILYAVGRGADIVVLDEPTAHLDVQAEARFFDDVIAAAQGATIILISHRMSTVRHADHIVLLQDGHICETGDHESLMASGGQYARLFNLQASRFTERTESTATHEGTRS